MLKVSVEKYVDGRRETGFSVPVPVVRWASGLLPQAAKRSLLQAGIYLDEMAEASAADAPFSRWIEVEEKGVKKSIKLSVAH
ncbi:MAG: hypothetical protein ABS75_30240 [Pelagibacterium sp. SCN 63-23]|jgi:hypothetical protein|nr:MAG: hypothetical protein ABS75_30240 [Pelagibacterium sp. SCN 63-23]